MIHGTGRVRVLLGSLCLTSGAAFLIHAASEVARARAWQESHAALFTARDPVPAVVGGAGTRAAPKRGEPLARLRVRRLGLDTMVAEGTDPGTLALGPGHFEGSALPGDPDNCIIAGHRDGAFGRLRSIRPGDQVELLDRSGLKIYRVSSATVVNIGDTEVLAPTLDPILTLVTCYPFDYVGPAPRRYVVRGALIDQES
jgi:LPXTG-site transpeptidase (sortase) family protein